MDEVAQTQPVTTRVITQEAEWDALRSEWSDLFGVSEQASPALHFDWMRTWWRIYGPHYRGRGGGLRILTIWRGSLLVGLLPLYLGVNADAPVGAQHLRFLSTGEAEFEETNPEYLDLLCRPGQVRECAAAVQSHLAGSDWDQLELIDLPESSPLATEEFRAGIGGAQVIPQGDCPVADLSGGFETYLQRLSAKNRQGARRMFREAERKNAVFELARAEQAGEFFDDLVRLHQDRWKADGKPGCFAAPRFTAFHRALVADWLPGGRAVLARLSAEGSAVAVLYGFRTGTKFDFYQSGVRTDDRSLTSPGILANLMLSRTLSEQGVLTYDYLRGSASYKVRFTTGQNRLVNVTLWRSTIRNAIHRSARFLHNTLDKGLNRLRRT